MNNDVDPFEEFEFKPITDGLGFHRNSAKLNTPVNKSTPTKKIVDTSSSELNFTQAKQSSATADSFSAPVREALFSTPLPNNKSKTTAPSASEMYNDRSSLSHTQTHNIVDEILKNIESSKQKTPPNFLGSKTEAKVITSRVELAFKPSGPLLTAMFLDSMLVVASSLLFLVALLAITKIDLLQNLKNPDDQGSVYISLFLLFSSVSFIYYVIFRSFLGYTPGEWAYDQKIDLKGGKLDFLALTKIALRSIIVFVTGGFVLPLVSWVFGKDLLGEFLDLPLVRKK